MIGYNIVGDSNDYFDYGEDWLVTSEEKIRILIADDHPLLREAIKNTFLSHDDIEVLAEAEDGVTAVRLCSELKPDVALMDIMMPQLNGIEATKQIRKVSPATAVIILTGYDDDRYVIGLLEAGAAGYLLKSTEGQALVRAVRSVHDGEAVLHSDVIGKILKYTTSLMSAGDEKEIKEPLSVFSARELEVLKLAARGMSNKDIAQELFITDRTVKAHLSSIFSKMGVASRTEALVEGLRMGWITLDDLSKLKS